MTVRCREYGIPIQQMNQLESIHLLEDIFFSFSKLTSYSNINMVIVIYYSRHSTPPLQTHIQRGLLPYFLTS